MLREQKEIEGFIKKFNKSFTVNKLFFTNHQLHIFFFFFAKLILYILLKISKN